MDISSLLNSVVPMDLDGVVNPAPTMDIDEPTEEIHAATTHPVHKPASSHVVIENSLDDDEQDKTAGDAFMNPGPDEFSSIADLPKPELEVLDKIMNVTIDGGVTKKITSLGSGWAKPGRGDEVHVLYVGRLAGTSEVFDSNQDVNSPFTFQLGQGMVIKGWDEGIKTMKKGEKAILCISPDYGYGSKGAGPKIPPNSTLEFEVTLINWKSVNSLSDDGKVVLKMLKTDPAGWQTPKSGWEVVVSYTGRIEGQDEPFIQVPDFTFIIDSKDAHTPPYFSEAIKKMKKGEVGQLIITITSGHDSTKSHPLTDPKIGILKSTTEYEIELLRWHEVEVLESVISKKTLKDGEGWDRPKSRYRVKVQVTGAAMQNKASNQFMKVDDWFVLGSGALPEAVEIALEKMKKGESAVIKAPADYGFGNTLTKQYGLLQEHDELVFDIVLEDWEKKKDSWDMSREEKLEDAQSCRLMGNDLFKEGKIRSAIKQYDQVVTYLGTLTSSTPEEKQQVDTLLLPAYLNLCACHLKASGGQANVFETANKAVTLCPTSAKALYRRAQSFSSIGEYEKALDDIKQAVKLEPKDAALRTEYTRISELLKEHRENQKKLFKRMFGKENSVASAADTTASSHMAVSESDAAAAR
ncbi:hypothetical protein SmJEL517_g03289 [Synchytrium microbalum]|uniref:peptidylprolyl isomerase n=1 Tax=Synchytrium microbalum TaxID=1806994 RepID=A0A507BWY5_9FUNG|nr:uncharacterized protein SmJEL517_g03289 [Synchytrium microbalum]TPX33850.1 hypothetical protein SmJEL517_g03289 [Synchytrium microbalum]